MTILYKDLLIEQADGSMGTENTQRDNKMRIFDGPQLMPKRVPEAFHIVQVLASS
jgi:hypothetical protein